MSAPTETRCNTCGRPVTTADRFCGFCGARLDGESATPTPQDTGEHRPHIDRILTALRAATIGEYDIAGELGRGGMAVVFLAHDLSLNRKVAIKVLLPELLYTEGMDRRFKHEARIAAKLDHPNILVIHGVREANDLLFIVMKLVEGLPLSAIAKVAGPLPVPVVRTIVRHVAEALAYAHGEGVVHRDVKPANIMVDRRGNVVVMDFGIAKAADDAHLTRTGLVIGTPAYMSPEQCLAHSVTPASDQYSLGIVAYELLTGKTPFRGSALEMQWAHATAAPPPVRSLRPDCPADLDAAVLRMMAKSPADRWPTLQDVSHAMTDDPATVSTARAALVSLVAEGPGRRDPTLPTTPASPVPIGPGPAAAGDATTDPVRGTTAYGVSANAGPANAEPANAEPRALVSNTSLSAAPAAPAMLTLSQQRIELTTGDSVELVVELDADEQSSDGSPVEWQTTDPNVATVSRNGFVTAMAPGLAEVVCVWRGRRAVCLVHVSAATAAVAPSPAAAAPPRAVPSQEAETDPIPALGAATPARKPVVSTGRRPGRLLWMGVLAAGVAAIAIYRAVRPSTFVAALPPDAATSPATPAAPAPPPATKGSPSPAPGPLEGAKPASPTSGVGSGRTTPAASTRGDTAGHAGTAAAGQRGPRLAVGGSSTAPPPTPGKTAPVSSKTSLPASQESASAAAVLPPTVPTVPPARPDSVRLTTRVDAGAASGYGATRPAAPTSAPASSPAASTAAAAAAKDSADDRIPPAPREVASALFKEFAAAINARSFSRITGAYPQPNDPDAAKLWQDFLVFVRDYTPRATIRSTTINDSSNPPTIAAVIDFRWSSDAGFDRVRSGTFVGIAVPIPGGWQLRGVKLGKRFW